MVAQSGKASPTRTIYLLRHAQALDATGREPDFSRALSDKGKTQVSALASIMTELDLRPDVVFCSPAVRTKQTFEGLKDVLKDSDSSFEDFLYLARAEQILLFLNSLDDGIESAMIIGHNSGIEDIAWSLSDERKSDESSYRNMMKKFPACSLAVIKFNRNWADLREKNGSLRAFIRPKDILGDK